MIGIVEKMRDEPDLFVAQWVRGGDGQLIDGAQFAQPPANLNHLLARVRPKPLKAKLSRGDFSGEDERRDRLACLLAQPLGVILRRGEEADTTRRAALPYIFSQDGLRSLLIVEPGRHVGGIVEDADPGAGVGDDTLFFGGCQFLERSLFLHARQDFGGAYLTGPVPPGKGPFEESIEQHAASVV